MAALRIISLFGLFGVVLGAAAASFVAPSFLAWYSTPGQGQALCSCAELVHDTANRLIQGQLLGSGAGALFGIVLGVLWVRGRKQSAAVARPDSTIPT